MNERIFDASDVLVLTDQRGNDLWRRSLGALGWQHHCDA